MDREAKGGERDCLLGFGKNITTWHDDVLRSGREEVEIARKVTNSIRRMENHQGTSNTPKASNAALKDPNANTTELTRTYYSAGIYNAKILDVDVESERTTYRNIGSHGRVIHEREEKRISLLTQ